MFNLRNSPSAVAIPGGDRGYRGARAGGLRDEGRVRGVRERGRIVIYIRNADGDCGGR